MKKLILTLIITSLSINTYSQNCKECVYEGRLSGNSYYIYVSSSTDCPNGPYGSYWTPIVDSNNTACLPVSLLDFRVDCNRISWETLSEVNNDYFTIYYSETMSNWEIVTSYGGAGSSNVPILYSLESTQEYRDGYYKLEQTDYDGAISSLSTKHLNCSDSDPKIKKVFNMQGELLGDEIPKTPGIYIVINEYGTSNKIIVK